MLPDSALWRGRDSPETIEGHTFLEIPMNRRTLFASIAGIVSFFGTKAVSEASPLQLKKSSLQTHNDLDNYIVDSVCEWLKNNGETAEISVSISGIPDSGRTLYFIPKENRVLRWGAPFYSTFHEKIFPGKDDWVLKTYFL